MPPTVVRRAGHPQGEHPVHERLVEHHQKHIERVQNDAHDRLSTVDSAVADGGKEGDNGDGVAHGVARQGPPVKIEGRGREDSRAADNAAQVEHGRAHNRPDADVILHGKDTHDGREKLGGRGACGHEGGARDAVGEAQGLADDLKAGYEVLVANNSEGPKHVEDAPREHRASNGGMVRVKVAVAEFLLLLLLCGFVTAGRMGTHALRWCTLHPPPAQEQHGQALEYTREGTVGYGTRDVDGHDAVLSITCVLRHDFCDRVHTSRPVVEPGAAAEERGGAHLLLHLPRRVPLADDETAHVEERREFGAREGSHELTP
mmetsp:Transcript_12258/g.36590  ORF Transcript_12258/g.36590 Transcript_12258/m.36590 type:complete len:317 (-) Transcript_12258:409-1359(-)